MKKFFASDIGMKVVHVSHREGELIGTLVHSFTASDGEKVGVRWTPGSIPIDHPAEQIIPLDEWERRQIEPTDETVAEAMAMTLESTPEDPELEAMRKIMEALEPLSDVRARHRVLSWARERFG